MNELSNYVRPDYLSGIELNELGRILTTSYELLETNNLNCIAGQKQLTDILRAIPVGTSYDFKKTDDHTIWVTAFDVGGSGMLAREFKL